jgi:predicted secreted hydrolase
MGKLNKVSILAVIVFALVIVASRALFFTQNSNHSSISISSDGVATSSQSFGRGFSNTNPELLGKVADPNYKISFPKDHFSHDSFDIEWWYLTANLQDDEGNNYGLQWTLFRFRNPNIANDDATSDWNNEHIYMAHASVHSASKHWFSEKFARGNVGNAGVEKTPFKLFIDNWQWSSATAGLLPAKLSFNAKLISNTAKNSNGSHLNVQLNLSNTGSYVLQGQDGYSIKSANGKHASHYYSAPFIDIDGTFTISEELKAPDLKPNQNSNRSSNLSLNELDRQIAVKGNAWFDQEWTSQLFDKTTLGWDWLSLHLENGDKIMAFRMRLQGQPDYITGTYIKADGSTTTLMPSDIELNVIESTAVGNKKLPLDWQLNIESKGLEVSIKATKKDQWNPASIAYYEGTVAVSGTHKGKGFLELTGY